MAKVFFWKEAVKDYKKLDGMLKQWVDAAGERLSIRGSEIGKDLGNTTYSKLAGFKELKNQKLGIRLIFKPTTDNQIEIIEIVAIGKREEEKVFLTAEKSISEIEKNLLQNQFKKKDSRLFLVATFLFKYLILSNFMYLINRFYFFAKVNRSITCEVSYTYIALYMNFYWGFLMIYATGISFKKDAVKTLESIVRIKLEADENETWKLSDKKIDGWYSKEDIHRWLTSFREKGFKIKVKLMPYSELEPVENNGVKYVRAVADSTEKNNLLKLQNYSEK